MLIISLVLGGEEGREGQRAQAWRADSVCPASFMSDRGVSAASGSRQSSVSQASGSQRNPGLGQGTPFILTSVFSSVSVGIPDLFLGSAGTFMYYMGQCCSHSRHETINGIWGAK